MFFGLVLDILNADDHILRAAYYLSVMWLVVLAIALIRKRLPLKTYIAGEIVLGLPSVFLFSRSDPLLHQLALSGVFLFETAIPVVWAVILLWLKRKSQQPRLPLIPIARTRALGFYLLGVSLYQIMVLFVLFYLPSKRLLNFELVLQPRIALFFASQLMEEVLNEFETPIYFWGAIWLLGLIFAVQMIRGRQPLKTYIITEIFLGIPGAGLLAMFFVSWQLTYDFRLWERLVATVVFLLVTALPIVWASWLLWAKRSIVKAKTARPVGPSDTSLSAV